MFVSPRVLNRSHSPALMLALLLASAPAPGEVLVLTKDRAVQPADVQIDAAGSVVPITKDGDASAGIPAAQVILLRFDVPPPHNQPGAWLCLHDGQWIRGDLLEIRPDHVVLKSARGPDKTVARDELAAIFFRSSRPELKEPPPAGARIIATNGDVLDAPTLELTNTGIMVDVDPDSDPIHLPRPRVAGVIWPARVAASSPARDPTRRLIELRTGERLIGRIVALDNRALTLQVGDTSRTIPRRDLFAIEFGRYRVRAADDDIGPAPASNDRPRYRRSRNALGAPLRIGQRVYQRGLGLRGPARVDIPVPTGARWFLAQVGADADAARFARVSLEILVDGQPRMQREQVAPGEPARTVAVGVYQARQISLCVRPAGDDPTGCLGDFADATFIIE